MKRFLELLPAVAALGLVPAVPATAETLTVGMAIPSYAHGVP